MLAIYAILFRTFKIPRFGRNKIMTYSNTVQIDIGKRDTELEERAEDVEEIRTPPKLRCTPTFSRY